ncbi:MAG: hypothetical protein MRK01_13795 [Candidatus Scalindua sp.]|nr:hypothetical protein [Candidatus Scalindua sp.]
MELTEKSGSYPVFEPNQILSDAHLNQARDYLDEQERLTRANLIGIGIICGLEIRYDPAEVPKTIHVSKGCGVTSEGYLIVESEDVSLVSYRKYELPGGIDYPAFKDSSSPPVQCPLWELFPAGEPDTTPLATNFLSDKSVLLFLELKEEGLRNCSPNNCDDKGLKVTATIRRLLVSQEDLNNISGSPLVEFQKSRFDVSEIPMRRINFSIPEDLRNYQEVFKNYFTYKMGGKTAVGRLVEAIDKAYTIIKLLLPDLNSFDKAKFNSFFTFQANMNVIAIQYYYDLLRDLTSTYHELRAALLQQLALCLPESVYFPRHLTLGVLVGSQAAEWRTGYFPSPAVASPRCKLGELRFLFERLNQLVLNFNIPSGPQSQIPIKITPSLFGLKHLSGKSMPFYYNPGLRQQWDAARKGQQSQEILSWHEEISSSDYIRNPLLYDLEPYNFFRVEGHVGKNVLDVTTSLGNLIIVNRLPITILYLNADAVGIFLEKHFAIEHEAGVMRGGTFVVLYGGAGLNANLVLCDFNLPYRIETRSSDCLCRVAIRECYYEWFDSKRHLSSLARLEYNKSKSKEFDRDLLSKYYVILIYHYEIQGRPVIAGSTPVQVRVPIAELVSGQISTIARKLNEKFPSGLVFDHDATTNKLVIRYFADQTFRIEWGGLQGNQIRYAYTQERIYRWQKGAWEFLNNVSKYKVDCRLRNDYRSDEYQWLQGDDYYSAKYPTPAPMPTPKDLIEWENMIQKRAAKSYRVLPESISIVLDKIKSKYGNFNVGNIDLRVFLIGSWANGSWVSLQSDENRFPRGFLDLRQKVTGKTGPSDIDLLVYIAPGRLNPEDVLNKLKEISEGSGYGINVVFGKEDAQKGIQII